MLTINNAKPTAKILTKKPNIDPSSTIIDCSFGAYVQIEKHNHIAQSMINSYSYTSENCQIVYSDIGKFVNIASYVRLNPAQHPMKWASQHHMLYRRELFGFGNDDEGFFEWRKEKRVFIGHDVWLGHNVTIMGGVNIGTGAVIGSGAIVTKDIPPYAIAVGNPAKVIKYRFKPHIIQSLFDISWWDWDHAMLKERIDEFKDIERFVELYE